MKSRTSNIIAALLGVVAIATAIPLGVAETMFSAGWTSNATTSDAFGAQDIVASGAPIEPRT